MDKYQTLREKDNPTNYVYPNIKTQNIPSSAITSVKIASGAVIASKIASGAIGSQHISAGAVNSNAISDGVITESKIANDAVTTLKIADGAIIGSKINDDAVSETKIKDEAVTLAKIRFYRLPNLDLLDEYSDFASFIGFLTSIRGTSIRAYHSLEFWGISGDFACRFDMAESMSGTSVYFRYFDNVTKDWKTEKIDNDADYVNFFATHRITMEWNE